MASNNGHISDYTTIKATQHCHNSDYKCAQGPPTPTGPPQAHSRDNLDFLKIASHNSDYTCTQGPLDLSPPTPSSPPQAHSRGNFDFLKIATY